MQRIFTLSTYLLIFSIATVKNTQSQTPLNHPKKAYQSEEEKLYWNRHVPLYIRLSDSPDDDAKSYPLKSDTSAKYTSPFYLDTEGVNLIRTKWAVNKTTMKTVEPKIEVMWEVYADGLPPASSIKILSDGHSNVGGEKYYGKNTIGVISATDKMSGLERSYHSINGNEFSPYSDSIRFNDERAYSVKFYSVDKVGNAEEAKIEALHIDLTPPQTTYSIQGTSEGNIHPGNAKVIFTSLDNASGVAKINYSVDGKAEKVYSTPLELATLPEGEHVISFAAIDKVNNAEVVKEYAFFLDKTAPKVTAEIAGDRFITKDRAYISGRSQIQITAEDNKAGVKAIFYSLNGAPFQEYSEPLILTSNGNTRISYYAVDNVGNKSAVENNSSDASLFTSYVDLAGPIMSHNFSGAKFETRDTVFINSSTKISFKGIDHESGLNEILYSINGKESEVYSKPVNLEKEGFYKIKVTGYDNVINSGEENFFVVVDNTGPMIFPVFDAKPIETKVVNDFSSEVYPSYVTLFLSVTDNQLGYDKIYYSINGQQEAQYANSIKGFAKGKDYKVKIRVLDKLGNTSIQELAFSIRD